MLLTVDESLPCDARDFHLWYDDNLGPRTAGATGDTIRIWIAHHEFGFEIWIEATTPRDVDPTIVAEIEDIVYRGMEFGG